MKLSICHLILVLILTYGHKLWIVVEKQDISSRNEFFSAGGWALPER